MSRGVFVAAAALSGLLVGSVGVNLKVGTELGMEHGSTREGRVLLADVRGPKRTTGDGVRVMGMLMDLHRCGHHVEVLCDTADLEELKSTWPWAVAGTHFKDVHFWTNSDWDKVNYSSFDKIVVGGKLDLLTGNGGHVDAVGPAVQLLYDHRDQFRHKVVTFWDDVPFERCHFKPEADEICPQVAGVVRKLAAASHKFYVLSVDDQLRLVGDMQNANISIDRLEVDVWPMSIANMQEALPGLRYMGPSNSRKLVTMMGNPHAVNTLMVTELFESEVLKTICDEIEKRGSDVKILFMGGVASIAADLGGDKMYSCVELQEGYISDEELEKNYFPITRAVLNPFFEDVNSGISVKNYESIMSGVPFLTSKYGMHGLSDEIPECAKFPMPEHPTDKAAFAKFVVDNVVDEEGYKKFAEEFGKHSASCIEGQRRVYPHSRICLV